MVCVCGVCVCVWMVKRRATKCSFEIGHSQHKLWPLKVSYENRPDLEKTPTSAFCQKKDNLGQK